MNYYVNLSNGTYSDRQEYYWVGDNEVTDEELKKIAMEIGDDIIAKEEEPKNSEWWRRAKEWDERMEGWLRDRGYTPLPYNIPEINVSYGDIPNSKDN